MKKQSYSLAEAAWFSLAQKIIPLIVFVAGFIPILLLIGFLKDHKIKGVENIGGILILFTFIAAFYSKMVLFKLKEDGRLSIRDACAHVFYSWLIYFQFLPVIGTGLSNWARRKERNRNPFVVENENNGA